VQDGTYCRLWPGPGNQAVQCHHSPSVAVHNSWFFLCAHILHDEMKWLRNSTNKSKEVEPERSLHAWAVDHWTDKRSVYY